MSDELDGGGTCDAAAALPAGGILDGMVEEVPTLRDEVEIGEIAISRWLMPKKQLLWMSGGRTLGSTHYDPYENLMAVVAGNKTFHLAHPDQGQLVGGFTRMREGQLHMAPGATALQRSPEQLTTQVRTPRWPTLPDTAQLHHLLRHSGVTLRIRVVTPISPRAPRIPLSPTESRQPRALPHRLPSCTTTPRPA